MDVLSMSLAAVAALACAFFLLFVWRASRHGWKRSYAFAHMLLLVGGVGALVPYHVAPSWVHGPTALGFSLIMCCGAVLTLRALTVGWSRIALDCFILSTCITLLVTAVGLMASGTMSVSRSAAIPSFICWATLFSAIIVLRHAAAQTLPGRLPRTLLTVFAISLYTSQFCVAATANTGNTAYVLVGDVAMSCALASVAVYAYLRYTTMSYAPARIALNTKPSLWWFALGITGVLIAQYAKRTDRIDPSLFGMALAYGIMLGITLRIIVSMYDIHRLQTKAQETSVYYRSLVADSSDVIALCSPDTTTISYASPVADTVLGVPPDSLIGQPLHEAIGATPTAVSAAIDELRDGEPHARIEGRLGQQITETMVSLRESHMTATIRDVTEREELRHSLHQMAYQDPVTGLANRFRIAETLDVELRRRGCDVSLLLADVDRFKQVNDCGGHALGDTVLSDIARRLQETLGHDISLGRLSGDEFAAIVRHGETSPSDAAAAVAEAMADPFKVDGRTFQLGASVGVVYAEPGVSAEEMLRRADVAMFAAKRNKKAVVVYEDGLSREATGTVEQDAIIAEVLRERRFKLFAQPIIDMATGEVRSVEGLVRWVCDGASVHGPWPLLDFATRTGQMRTVTDWVVKSAAETLQRVPTLPRLSVNIPPEDLLDPLLPERLTAQLAAHGVPTHRLTVEITENELIGEAHRRTNMIAQLRELGFSVMIDDFGSGYSSLGYLANLPVSGFKLDRSFVMSLNNSHQALTIVRSLVDMANESDLKLVVEGIETAEEHRVLRSLGCGLAQGYFYAMPEELNSDTGIPCLAWWANRSADNLNVVMNEFDRAVKSTPPAR